MKDAGNARTRNLIIIPSTRMYSVIATNTTTLITASEIARGIFSLEALLAEGFQMWPRKFEQRDKWKLRP
jgi:hypothetical protein